MPASSIDAFALAEQLERAGQRHLISDLDALEAAERGAYLARLSTIDWHELQHPSEPVPPSEVGPSRVVDLGERARRARECSTRGEEAYRDGRVAVLMVAGGQGTRLGFAGAKGCFAIGAHSGKSIYQLQAEKVLSLSRRVARQVPFLIMTSPATDAETREFFAANGYFALEPSQCRFFVQGMLPSLAKDGLGLREAAGRLLENPDGHGGAFTALVASGELDRLRRQGVAQLVYIQVDNILAPVDDPLLVGLALAERADVVTKVLEKTDPDEKVGHLVRVRGADGEWRDRVIEYTELSKDEVRRLGADGKPLYRWGSPAMHAWSVDFMARLADRGYRLPVHRSAKPLKAWSSGAIAEIAGWKNERFIFDLIPEARTSIGLAIDRAAEFAPVKNARGVDSAESAVAMASALYAHWLRQAGVTVELPANARIEISPLFAATEEQFRARWDKRIARVNGDYYLEE